MNGAFVPMCLCSLEAGIILALRRSHSHTREKLPRNHFRFRSRPDTKIDLLQRAQKPSPQQGAEKVSFVGDGVIRRLAPCYKRWLPSSIFSP